MVFRIGKVGEWRTTDVFVRGGSANPSSKRKSSVWRDDVDFLSVDGVNSIGSCLPMLIVSVRFFGGVCSSFAAMALPFFGLMVNSSPTHNVAQFRAQN